MGNVRPFFASPEGNNNFQLSQWGIYVLFITGNLFSKFVRYLFIRLDRQNERKGH